MHFFQCTVRDFFFIGANWFSEERMRWPPIFFDFEVWGDQRQKKSLYIVHGKNMVVWSKIWKKNGQQTAYWKLNMTLLGGYIMRAVRSFIQLLTWGYFTGEALSIGW